MFKPYVIEPVNTLDSWDYTVNLNWQITDNFSLLAVYPTANTRTTSPRTPTVRRWPHNSCCKFMDHEQDTYELRFNLTAGILDLTFGAFYLDQDTAEHARVDLPYVGFDFIHGPDLVPSTSDAILRQRANCS